MRNLAILAALVVGTALGLAGCRTTDKAPDCRSSDCVPVNSPEHYPQESRP